MRGLANKRVVVCGGATGIGAATAERLAEEGCRVLIGDVNAAGAEATAKRITAAGGTALWAEFDLAAAAAFLLSDDAEWINGQTRSIDGGGSLHD